MGEAPSYRQWHSIAFQPMASISFKLFLALVVLSLYPTEAQNIGIGYGSSGDNLPTPQETVQLCKSNGISKLRLYSPDLDLLKALQGSGITIILGVPSDQLSSLGSNQSAAAQWVKKYVAPFGSTVKYISVGNEVMPTDSAAEFLLPAIQNVQTALATSGLAAQIKVTTSMGTGALTNTFPPSNGIFISRSFFTPIVKFLKSNGSPLLASVFPYFTFVQNTGSISLQYALFTAPGPVVTDSGNGLQYQNLFDAIVDAFYAALESSGGKGVGVVVSESGWPSQGNDVATATNAWTYYKNLIEHVGSGTPKRPGKALETYLFVMYDEDQKPGDEDERHFGLFTPARQNKYGLAFSAPNLLGFLCYD